LPESAQKTWSLGENIPHTPIQRKLFGGLPPKILKLKKIILTNQANRINSDRKMGVYWLMISSDIKIEVIEHWTKQKHQIME